jgi:hypothetical protein
MDACEMLIEFYNNKWNKHAKVYILVKVKNEKLLEHYRERIYGRSEIMTSCAIGTQGRNCTHQA